MFAVIKTGGKQYLVKVGQTLKIEKLDGEKGANVVFDKVLLVAQEDGSDVKIGTPYLNALVKAEILEQGRNRKILVINFKRKVRYSGKVGHRQPFTKVKITEIK